MTDACSTARYLIDTPAGAATVTIGPQGLRALEMATDGGHLPPAPPETAAAIRSHLAQQSSPLPLDLSGLTPLAQQVLRAISAIPAGQVRSYAWLAHQVGRPRAVRAVARCVARNPLPLVVPCHRVVGSDGRLRGYRFGLDVKWALLIAEGAWPPAPQPGEAPR